MPGWLRACAWVAWLWLAPGDGLAAETSAPSADFPFTLNLNRVVPANLLANPSFEEGEQLPNGWNTYAYAGTVLRRDATVGRTGTASGLIEVTAAAACEFPGFNGTLRPVQAGADPADGSARSGDQSGLCRLWRPCRPGALAEAIAAGAKRVPPAATPSPLRAAVLAQWSSRPLPAGGLDMKVDGPRILLARLATRQDVAAINRFLQGLTPWAASGSEWDVREVLGWQKSYADKLRIGHRGDYDFTEAGLISIRLLFADQPDLLYPDTAQHIVDALVIDKGKAPRPHVPGSLGLVDETENHSMGVRLGQPELQALRPVSSPARDGRHHRPIGGPPDGVHGGVGRNDA